MLRTSLEFSTGVLMGGLLPNEGEKEFVGYDTDGRKRGVKVQLAGVTRPLMRVRRIVERGN